MQTITLPSFESYGQYAGDNYGAHTLRFWLPDGSWIAFSYKTPVAFYTHKTGKRVRVNEWGPTTGKHLNWLDDGNKDSRIPGDQFEAEMAESFPS